MKAGGATAVGSKAVDRYTGVYLPACFVWSVSKGSVS